MFDKIVLVLLLVFGTTRLPQLGESLGKGIKKLQGQANNTCSFSIELGRGNQFISLSSILINSEDEQQFKESSKLIEINVSSDDFDKKVLLNESVLIENLGW